MPAGIYSRDYMNIKCPRCRRFNAPTDPFCRCGLDLRAEQVKDKFSGECWFCTQDGALTKEHVIPQWTFKHAGVLDTNFQHTIGRLRDPSDFQSEMVYGRGRLFKRKTAGGQWAPIACENCNGGWMKRLNDQAQPLARPFISGHHPKLDGMSRYVLARWLGVIASGSEYYVGLRNIPQFQRSMLVEGSLSPQWLFSYARCGSSRLNCTLQVNSQHWEPRQSDSESFLVSSWITIGNAVFHVFAAGAPWDVWRGIGSYPEFQSRYGLRSLWPQMVEQPAAVPHILTWSRVRRAQQKIIAGNFRPTRELLPEDLTFML